MIGTPVISTVPDRPDTWVMDYSDCYNITSADNVLLTPPPRDRYKELWHWFNNREQWPYSGSYNRQWAEREGLKQQMEDER